MTYEYWRNTKPFCFQILLCYYSILGAGPVLCVSPLRCGHNDECTTPDPGDPGCCSAGQLWPSALSESSAQSPALARSGADPGSLSGDILLFMPARPPHRGRPLEQPSPQHLPRAGPLWACRWRHIRLSQWGGEACWRGDEACAGRGWRHEPPSGARTCCGWQETGGRGGVAGQRERGESCRHKWGIHRSRPVVGRTGHRTCASIPIQHRASCPHRSGQRGLPGWVGTTLGCTTHGGRTAQVSPGRLCYTQLYSSQPCFTQLCSGRARSASSSSPRAEWRDRGLWADRGLCTPGGPGSASSASGDGQWSPRVTLSSPSYHDTSLPPALNSSYLTPVAEMCYCQSTTADFYLWSLFSLNQENLKERIYLFSLWLFSRFVSQKTKFDHHGRVSPSSLLLPLTGRLVTSKLRPWKNVCSRRGTPFYSILVWQKVLTRQENERTEYWTKLMTRR